MVVAVVIVLDKGVFQSILTNSNESIIAPILFPEHIYKFFQLLMQVAPPNVKHEKPEWSITDVIRCVIMMFWDSKSWFTFGMLPTVKRTNRTILETMDCGNHHVGCLYANKFQLKMLSLNMSSSQSQINFVYIHRVCGFVSILSLFRKNKKRCSSKT